MSWLKNLWWNVYAQWMGLKSFWKADWSLDDYPIRIRFQANREPVMPSRLKLIPYSAGVVNWLGLMGAGSTKQEALAALQKNFENFKGNGRKLMSTTGAKCYANFLVRNPAHPSSLR